VWPRFGQLALLHTKRPTRLRNDHCAHLGHWALLHGERN
jgi:hypothetical protein